MSVELGLRGSSSTPASADSGGTEFRIESARGSIRSIELDLPAGQTCATIDSTQVAGFHCDASSQKLRLEGPFAIDLLTREATPSLDGFSVPPGRYARADVRFDDADPRDGVVGDADPLAEQTLIASGSFEHEGATHRFSLSLDFDEDARFEAPGGVEVGGDAEALLLELDVARWFSALPITECMDRGELQEVDGALQLRDGDGGCSSIENTIKSSIKSSGQLDRR